MNENTKTNASTNNTKVYNLIIVDESGSMCVIHEEALAGINETLTTCQKMQQLHPKMEQRVTLITFDSQHFKLHFDNQLASETHPLTSKDYNPCAATPLYDAIGKGIAKLNAQAEPGANVLVTIITDGEENCSKEYNLKMVNTLIEKLKTQNWTFTLIGTDNLDVEGMAGAMGIVHHMAFTEDEESTRKMFAKERHSREVFYCLCEEDGCLPEGVDYFVDED